MSPVADHGWWLASRASGIVALALVTASVLLGLTMASRALRGPRIGPALSAIHEQTALTGLVCVAVHGIALLGDGWLHPGPEGVLVPFAIAYRPAWTGLGIVAGYLGAALGLSFYARHRVGPRLWRRAHRLTVVVYALAVAHTLGAGTDAGSPWLRRPLLASAAVVTILFLVRAASRGPAAVGRRRPAPRPSGRSSSQRAGIHRRPAEEAA